jgi:hypothetical protein
MAGAFEWTRQRTTGDPTPAKTFKHELATLSAANTKKLFTILCMAQP